MAKHDDPSRTAAEFLQLWQEHLTRQMTDPATIHAMLAAMQQFSAGVAQGAQHDATARRPTAASDAQPDAVERLSQRLGKLERTVAKLASRMDATQEPTRAKPRRVKRPAQKIQRGKPRMAKATTKRRIRKKK